MLNFCAKDLINKEEQKIFCEIDDYIDLGEDVSSVGNAIGIIKFKLKNDFLLAVGDVKSSVELVCDRCLKTYVMDLDISIDEAIEINDKPVHAVDMEFDMENFHEQITSTETVNVKDLIRQYIVLNLPTKRICSEDCVNENVEKVNKNGSDLIDPRWEKLKSISYDNKNDNNEGE